MLVTILRNFLVCAKCAICETNSIFLFVLSGSMFTYLYYAFVSLILFTKQFA